MWKRRVPKGIKNIRKATKLEAIERALNMPSEPRASCRCLSTNQRKILWISTKTEVEVMIQSLVLVMERRRKW